ncbi:MAG: molybdate ABC transporter permease subunit [Acidimicrobiales bacterium]
MPTSGLERVAVGAVAPLVLSLQVAALAAVLATVVGVAGGYALAKGRFPGRGVLEMVASLPVVLPPTVVGYYLLAVLGVGTPLGQAWEWLTGGPIALTATGCVVAATVGCAPFALRASRAAIAGVDPRLEAAARAAGRGEWRVAWLVTLPLARRGIAAGVALAFARALGDFGATLTLAGSIPGRTQTATTAIYDAFLRGDQARMAELSLALLVVGGGMLVLISRLEFGPRPTRQPPPGPGSAPGPRRVRASR